MMHGRPAASHHISKVKPENRVGLLNTLLGGHHQGDAPDLLRAIAWAVDRIEPVLKQVGGYPERYRKPVAHALAYARALADEVPGPIPITTEAYASNPLVHALFAVQDDLHAAMSASRAMQLFQRDYPAANEVYALLCMRRRTKKMFGMEMQGDILRRDVRQEAVFFTDYTIAEPGLTEAEARERIARGFFESLIVHVANRIEERKLERSALEQKRDELLARMRSAPPDQHAVHEAELRQVLGQLGEIVASLELSHYGNDFDAVLFQPDKHLYLERAEFNLDSMGIVRSPEDDGSAEIDFCDLIGRDRRRWTVIMMYCDHVKDGASIADRLESAERWLGL
jgi:hypothetical protein